MSNRFPVNGITPISEMAGDDAEETGLLRVLAEQAESYVTSFKWCRAVRELFFGAGIGGIFGVFFAWIDPSLPNVDEFLWVIVGDIPPAYLVTDDSRTPKEAMSVYIDEMGKWVSAAKRGQTSADIIPVNVAATPENARLLETRLNTLEKEILPHWFVE